MIERSVNKVILEGKVYYIHVVKPGQTLYSIARAYNISQKEISVENPGVISGIRIGQTLKIPVEPSIGDEQIDTSDPRMNLKDKNTHKVKRGETFYSISKIYGITPEELQEANPGVRMDDMRPGQRLIIPEPAPASSGARNLLIMRRVLPITRSRKKRRFTPLPLTTRSLFRPSGMLILNLGGAGPMPDR